MDEQASIKGELDKWREQCEVWSKAFHRAAQSTLAWNSRLVVIAIAAAAIATGISGVASQEELAFLSYIVAGVGIVIAIVNGLQKVTFANPESAKEYHNAAIEYGKVARLIERVRLPPPPLLVVGKSWGTSSGSSLYPYILFSVREPRLLATR